MKKIILLGDGKKINNFLFSLKDQKFKNVKYRFNICNEEVCIEPFHSQTNLDEANAVVYMPSDNPDFYEANVNYTYLLTQVPNETLLVEYDNDNLDNEPKIFMKDLVGETPEKETPRVSFNFFNRHSHHKDNVRMEVENVGSLIRKKY